MSTAQQGGVDTVSLYYRMGGTHGDCAAQECIRFLEGLTDQAFQPLTASPRVQQLSRV